MGCGFDRSCLELALERLLLEWKCFRRPGMNFLKTEGIVGKTGRRHSYSTSTSSNLTPGGANTTYLSVIPWPRARQVGENSWNRRKRQAPQPQTPAAQCASPRGGSGLGPKLKRGPEGYAGHLVGAVEPLRRLRRGCGRGPSTKRGAYVLDGWSG